MKSLDSLMKMYRERAENLTHLRLGQFFVNLYFKNSWPQLFYEVDEKIAKSMISSWLVDNCYTEELPKPVPRTIP